jgi:hypothetical protein
MMVPAFSPKSTKLVYVNGDSDIVGGLTATGWRRGLTMLNFGWNGATSTYTVSSKVRLINNYNSTTPGVPVKWPFFEPDKTADGDGRSLLYVESETTEFCSSTDVNAANPGTDPLRACSQAPYGSAFGARGNMTPTTRGYWKGKIYSLDTSNPATTRVELSKLNDADDDLGVDDAKDGDRAYQPTVLPFASGGYRWVIFTSPRAFGNQVNPRSYKADMTYGNATHFSCAAPMLWVSALTDNVANGLDRSNPAFWLPGQYASLPNSTGAGSGDFINERGYIVPSPCKADGLSCTSDDECCGADTVPVSGACRAPAGWTPASGAPAKTCEKLDDCHKVGESCNTNTDCCNGASCKNFACEAPANLQAATFTREYIAECPVGYHPNWGLFSYHLTTQGDSSLSFTAQTSKSLDTLDAAPIVNVGASTNTVVSPAAAEYKDVGAALVAAGQSRNYNNLRIMVTFNPSTDKTYAPFLHDWEQRYTCEPAE